MFEQLHSAIDTLEAVVRDLEPGLVDGAGATRLVELFARGEHMCAAGKALATRRRGGDRCASGAGASQCRRAAGGGERGHRGRGGVDAAHGEAARGSPGDQRSVPDR